MQLRAPFVRGDRNVPNKTTRNENVLEIRLSEIDRLAADLAGRVRAEGFVPEVVVYVETGARLPARALCRLFGVPAIAVWVRRPGARIKSLLAPIAALLPRTIKDFLRNAEERSQIHGTSTRRVKWEVPIALAGQRVLIVDDAADTGRTVAAVRAELVRCGVPATSIRAAVLAATQPAALQVVDFHLFAQKCRMPWSADSCERRAAVAEMRQTASPAR